ncbi:TPA: AAA family ATPase [Photobacterium damselae]
MIYKRLMINRFIVFQGEKVMYDQKFHTGINVIRGEHSVGKSTLLDLIFYSLGGELKDREWKEPIETYSKVIVEVHVGDVPLTLIRAIDTTNKKPYIDVFDGSYEESIRAEKGWLHLGPTRSENKMSFSEFFFEALGWGQSITSNNNNLTMHQVLRLLYLSQSSDSTKIFRSEVDSKYDSASTRQAIGDFVLGLDDLSLYESRQKKWRLTRNIDSIESDIKSYKHILGIDESTALKDYNDAIEDKRNELEICVKEKNRKLSTSSTSLPYDFTDNIAIISNDIAVMTSEIKHFKEKVLYIKSEITDCLLFDKSLDFRLKSLLESKNTFIALGEMSFTYCPNCFSSIKEVETEACKCSLCKNDMPKHSLEEKYTETLSELKYQQRQNKKTVDKLNIRLEELNSLLTKSISILREKESELRNLSTSTNEREIIIEEYSKKISKLERELDDKIDDKETYLKIDTLFKEKKLKEEELFIINKNIEDHEVNSKERRFRVLQSISKTAKQLLESDLGNEHNFREASSLSDEINFGKDEWSVGGRVTFSDSSNVVKKSSLQISMLNYAITDNESRLPNFMILDFECGDLNAPRSHCLQKNLMEILCQKNNYQVIITSSKVCDELNNEIFGVGPYYGTNEYIFSK